jgi:hypothetical protein
MHPFLRCGVPRRFTRPANTYDLLKSVAVLTMLVDHVGMYLFPDQMWFRVVGRTAFPVFLFLVGYSGHTRTDRRLLLSAVVMSVLDYLVTGSLFPLNVLWAIALTRWVLGRWNSGEVLLQSVPLVLGWALSVPFVAYGTSAVLLGALGAWARHYGETLSRRFIIFVWVLVGLHTLSQLLSFPFDPLQGLGVILVGGSVAYTLSHFTLRPRALPKGMLWLSRYALEFYVLHLVILTICARVGQGGLQ